MKKTPYQVEHNYFSVSPSQVIETLGRDKLLSDLEKMLAIRNFELRAESAYQQGFIGGFFHAYNGQEAIQTALLRALGKDHWFVTSYRCHALALLLGATPNELMAELYGRSTGNAKGRGGSMHFFTERLLGGFGIVGGQIPIATGAAFAIKYRKKKEEVAVCFFGDGAVAQGTFHESLNLASLWDLPCIYVIENNLWGMGTAVTRAICVEHLAEDKAPGYGMKGYTLDGTDYFSCYTAFLQIYQEVLATNRPVLVEVVAERFRGHSISDPGLYRSKEEIKDTLASDPIAKMRDALIDAKMLDEETFKKMDKEQKELIVAAMRYAEESPWPNILGLEEEVFAS